MSGATPPSNRFNWRALLKDLRLWLGVVSGIAATFGGLLLRGDRLLDAPDIATEAQEMAVDNSSRLDRMEMWREDLRIIFCTKPDWLSEQARARLQCWRIEGERGARGR